MAEMSDPQSRDLAKALQERLGLKDGEAPQYQQLNGPTDGRAPLLSRALEAIRNGAQGFWQKLVESAEWTAMEMRIGWQITVSDLRDALGLNAGAVYVQGEAQHPAPGSADRKLSSTERAIAQASDATASAVAAGTARAHGRAPGKLFAGTKRRKSFGRKPKPGHALDGAAPLYADLTSPALTAADKAPLRSILTGFDQTDPDIALVAVPETAQSPGGYAELPVAVMHAALQQMQGTEGAPLAAGQAAEAMIDPAETKVDTTRAAGAARKGFGRKPAAP